MTLSVGLFKNKLENLFIYIINVIKYIFLLWFINLLMIDGSKNVIISYEIEAYLLICTIENNLQFKFVFYSVLTFFKQ